MNTSPLHKEENKMRRYADRIFRLLVRLMARGSQRQVGFMIDSLG